LITGGAMDITDIRAYSLSKKHVLFMEIKMDEKDPRKSLIIDVRSLSHDPDRMLKMIAMRANELGIEDEQIQDLRIKKTFGEGVEIKFITTHYVHYK
jgi:hypothetical protein